MSIYVSLKVVPDSDPNDDGTTLFMTFREGNPFYIEMKNHISFAHIVELLEPSLPDGIHIVSYEIDRSSHKLLNMNN